MGNVTSANKRGKKHDFEGLDNAKISREESNFVLVILKRDGHEKRRRRENEYK